MSDGNGTPDSWEQTTNSSTDSLRNDIAKKISTLNVNAAEFVPNFGSFGTKAEKNTSGNTDNDQSFAVVADKSMTRQAAK